MPMGSSATRVLAPFNSVVACLLTHGACDWLRHTLTLHVWYDLPTFQCSNQIDHHYVPLANSKKYISTQELDTLLFALTPLLHCGWRMLKEINTKQETSAPTFINARTLLNDWNDLYCSSLLIILDQQSLSCPFSKHKVPLEKVIFCLLMTRHEESVSAAAPAASDSRQGRLPPSW